MIEKPATKDDIKDFANWLDSKPEFDTYNSDNPTTCAIAQYLGDRFDGDVEFWDTDEVIIDGEAFKVPQEIIKIAYGGLHPSGSHFFRYAYQRAIKVLGEL